MTTPAAPPPPSPPRTPPAQPRTPPRTRSMLRRLHVGTVRELRPVAGRALPLGAAAAIVLAWRAWPAPVVPALVVLALVGAPLALIDARSRRLPDTLTLPALAVTAVLVVGPSAVVGQSGPAVRAVAGAVAAGGVHLILWFADAGIGLGDVKLVALLALPLAWFGWGTLLAGVFLGYLLGGLWSLALLATRRARLRSTVAFGPFLLAGAFVALVTA